MRLYELSDAYSKAIEKYNLAESDEELESALAEIEAFEEPFEQKINSVCIAMTEFAADAEGYGKEIERLQRHQKRAVNAADRIKAYVKRTLEQSALPEKKIKTELFAVRIQKNGGKVPVTLAIQPADLPKEFRITVPVHYEADTDAIRAAHEAGKELPFGVIVEERGTHVRIQ